MKSGCKITIWFVAVLLIGFLGGCTQEKQLPAKSRAVDDGVADVNVVGEIGEHVITKEQIRQAGRGSLREDLYIDGRGVEPRSARELLKGLIAEKAMAIEGRSEGLLEDEVNSQSIKRFRDKQLVSMLLRSQLESKVEVTESQIEALMASDAKLTRETAHSKLAQEQANELREQYYGDLYKKFKVKKFDGNLRKVRLTHYRLLQLPRENKRAMWVTSKQVRGALTDKERATVLAEFDGVQITIKDWLYGLCEIAPPGRAGFIKNDKGVGQMLDRVLKAEIFVHEAVVQGFDKNENFVKKLREREDSTLQSKQRSQIYKDIKVVQDEEELIAYFNANKENFGKPATLKVDQIWCEDLKSAQEARGELDGGKDFGEVKSEYDVMGEMQQKEPQVISPIREGFFFDDMWAGDVGDIVGPVKGISYQGLKWRVVKIYEKTPGEIKEYSEDMKSSVQMKMRTAQIEEAMGELNDRLLKKYPHKIYEDRIAEVDVLEIP